MVEILSGVGPLLDRCDAFVLDQWGVLHRGTHADESVVQALTAIKAAGKRIVLLSNSGRRASGNLKRLSEWGIGSHLLDAVITSGEAAWRDFSRLSDPFYAGLGKRCFVISRHGDLSVLEETGVERADAVTSADFVLLAGLDDEPDVRLQARGKLAEALAARLPLVCANPDRVGLMPDGTNVAPGTLAAEYRDAGGKVRMLGKPFPEIYEMVAEALPGIPPDRMIAVGDSLEHDIAGGRTFGMGTAFVTSGIHAPSFGDAFDPTSQEVIDLVEAEAAAMPISALGSFKI